MASPKTPEAPPVVPQSLDELIDSAAASAVNGDGALGESEVVGTEVSMGEILRLRKMRRTKGGVGFRAQNQGNRICEEKNAPREENGDTRLVQTLSATEMRFAPQTGTVLDVNRHM